MSYPCACIYTVLLSMPKTSTSALCNPEQCWWPCQYLFLAAPDNSIVCCRGAREVNGFYKAMIAQECTLLGRSIHNLDIACLHQRSIRFPARVLEAPNVASQSMGGARSPGRCMCVQQCRRKYILRICAQPYLQLKPAKPHLMNFPRYSFTGFILHTTTASSAKSLCRMSMQATGVWLPAPSTRDT